jgi:hypothetical protein
MSYLEVSCFPIFHLFLFSPVCQISRFGFTHRFLNWFSVIPCEFFVSVGVVNQAVKLTVVDYLIILTGSSDIPPFVTS